MRLPIVSDLLGSPHFHAICLVITSTAAIEALLAIWAATSRRHWFWRALAVWAGIVVLLPIRAYQPALVFAITSPLTIALVRLSFPRSAWERTSGRSASHAQGEPEMTNDDRRHISHLRFSLGDLLLATALVGLALATLLHVLPRIGTIPIIELALALAGQTIIPVLAWLTIASRRPRICLAALLLSVVSCAAATYWMWRSLSSDWTLIGVLFEGGSGLTQFRSALVAFAELALILFTALAVSAALPAPSRLRIPAFTIGGAWAICLALIYLQMLGLLPLPPSFVGGTNHYLRLIEVCEQMRSIEKAGFPKSREPDRQALIAEAVTLAAAANFVPYNPPANSTTDAWNKFIAPSQNVRGLARVIDSECGAALARGDLDRAVALAITNIRLGAMLQRGGTVVEDLIGVAVHGIANHRLAELRSGLSPDQARQIITAWEQALNDREPLESIIYRDRAMAERAYGWAARLGNILEGIPIRSNIYEPMQQACFRHETTARLLQTELALQLYRVEHGQMAESLDQLVPGYLPAVPLDAWSQQPLIYRLTESGFVLYSVGYDGQDNGGRVTNLKTYYTRDGWGRIGVGYDFDLDTTIRP